MTELKKEYRRIRHNIQNRLYRARKQGIVIEKIQLPKIPKEVTEASIRKLKRTEDKFATHIYKIREKKRKKLNKSRKPKSTKTKQNVKSSLKTPKIKTIKPTQPKSTTDKENKKTQKIDKKPQKVDINIEKTEEIETDELPPIDIDTLFDIAVDRIYDLLNVMDNYPIEVFSAACKQGATEDIEDFINSHDKETVIKTLQSWDMEELTVTFFDSNMADMYCHERIVAQHLASISQTISNNMDNFNEVDDYMTGFEGMMYMDD